MGREGAQGAADGIEQWARIEAETDVVDEAGAAPARGLRARGLADPAQHLLGAIGGGGGKAAGLQLSERDALLVAEAAISGFEDGPAGRLGELAAMRLVLAHRIDCSGEQLDDMEPVDGDRSVGEALSERRQ